MSVFDEIDQLPDDPVVLRAALNRARDEFNVQNAQIEKLRSAISSAAGGPASGPVAHPAALRGKTVIAIDDSKVMQMRYRSLLTTFGWDLLGVAENGAFGADLVITRHPLVVLLDYEMPVMNGVETLAEIRRADKDVKVLVVSGTLTTELLQTLMQNGANDVLVKPINEEKLREALDRCIGE